VKSNGFIYKHSCLLTHWHQLIITFVNLIQSISINYIIHVNSYLTNPYCPW